MVRSVSTGCRTLDEMLGGGIPLEKITLIYGEPSTGKTTLALGMAVSFLSGAIEDSGSSRVLYIDSDRKLSLDRFSQIAGRRADEFLERLIVSMPDNFSEQTLLIEQLVSYISANIDFIVFDTVTSLYQEEVASGGGTFPASREFNRQLGYLKEAVEDQHVTVLLLSQVHSSLHSEPPVITPISTRLLRYWSDTIIQLELTPQTGVRAGFIEKPRRSLTGCMFKLAPFGIVDMGPAERVQPRKSG